jgi:hypothetical protein
MRQCAPFRFGGTARGGFQCCRRAGHSKRQDYVTGGGAVAFCRKQVYDGLRYRRWRSLG